MSGIATPDHTVPYGTVLSVVAIPVTSCQATIMLSLWDENILLSAKARLYLSKGLENVQTPGVGFQPMCDSQPGFLVICAQ
jgi:hypothetical protein